MADAPKPGTAEERPSLTLFDDEPAPRRREPASPPGPPGPGEPAPAGGLRETILRFLEEEL